MSLSKQIAAIPAGGCWAAPLKIKRTYLERVVAIAERKTGRLFKVTSQADKRLFVEDVSPSVMPKVRASRRGQDGLLIDGSIRHTLTRGVVEELGGPEKVRALVEKYRAGGIR